MGPLLRPNGGLSYNREPDRSVDAHANRVSHGAAHRRAPRCLEGLACPKATYTGISPRPI